MQHALEIENQTCWPPEFANGIAGNRSLLLDFHRERSRIDGIAENDVRARIDRPDNRFERDYRTVVARLEALLLPHRIVAYHCTRLTPGEIAAITTSGMRLLSPALVQSRLDQGLADGYLTRTA